MFNPGCYYIWNIMQKSNIGYSITHFRNFVINTDEQEGIFAYEYGNLKRNGWAYSSNTEKKMEYNEEIPVSRNISIDKQLNLIEKQVNNRVPFYKLSNSLIPLEKLKYWTESLQQLLNEYFQYEKEKQKKLLEIKCTNFLKILKEGDYGKFSIRLTERNYPYIYSMEINTGFQKIQDWFLNKFHIKEYGRTGRKYEIHIRDLVLHFPLFRELAPKTKIFDQDRSARRGYYYRRQESSSQNQLYDEIKAFWGVD